MFKPFRQNQKRKVHSHSNGTHKDQNESKGMPIPTLPLKLFMQQDQQESNPKNRQIQLHRDDSSMDLSVYTTESKTTVQYPPRDPYGRTDSAEWPSPRASVQAARATTNAAEQSTMLGVANKVSNGHKDNPAISPKSGTAARVQSWMHESPPSTAPSTPPRELDHPDDEDDVEDYFDYDHRILQRKQDSLANADSTNPASRSTNGTVKSDRVRRGPVDLDEVSEEDEEDDNSLKAQHFGHARDDVFRPMVSQVVLSEEIESDAHNSPIVWTDHDDDDCGAFRPQAPPRLSAEDTEALNQSFNETMQSISFHSIHENKEYNAHGEEEDCGYCSDEMGTGAVLLTQQELEKHLTKVQNKEQMYSSSIGGYDQWKQQQEYQRRYFEKLQQKVSEKKQQQQYLKYRQHRNQYRVDHSPRGTAHLPTPYNRSPDDSLPGFTRHTYDHMDKSVTSTIATERTEDPSMHDSQSGSEKSKAKRRWNILPKLTGTSKKKNATKKDAKVQQRHVSPPRKAAITHIEEVSEVANVSLAPLNTMLGMNVGSHGEPKELVSRHLQQERVKQIQAEKDKERLEWNEQERIRRMKERELQRQRQLNNIRPTRRRDHSPGPITPSPSRDSTENGSPALCCTSFESDISGTKSAKMLSPCILCDEAERTHIAMPCMHFYFCGGCADRLTMAKDATCPVCGIGGVSFARVYTG